ncbi:hypothetical protein [Neobacillus mesonae]|uniref:hypothetical protein n=1 Tax=Neobacillus mesonae TaxID=1193713 RepID=UPI00203BC902|nr:hypothetical protein [Neobacillus mesonae]MCM3569844.1 hypothetical protein [Neobacillus mesonae]
MAKKVKSVAFNDEVAEEKEILKHVSRRNFSKYVKQLIKQDMAAKSSEKIQIEQETSPKTLTSSKKNRYKNYR